MAYTKAPTMDTYSAERVNLYREMSLRDGAVSGKDEDYVNVIIEPVRQSKINDDRKFLFKRAGSETVLPSVASTPVRGMWFWADQYKLLYAVGRNVYIYNVNTAVSTTLTNVFATSTGIVGFCEFLYDNGAVVICATDGSAISGLVTIDTANTVTTCTDVDLPAHLPYPVYLDGYLFLAKASSADIYNSNLNDPLNWTAGTLVQTEMEADYVLRIAKLNNYLVAFGSETIEYFWDAVNAAPSSPMQRNDTPIKMNRYLGGLAQYGNSLFYIGQDANGQPDVFMLKDFKIENIGSATISKYLDSAADGISNWTGNIISSTGHVFYIITAGANKTFVYDIESSLWTRWAFKQNTTFDLLTTTIATSTVNTKTYFALYGNDSTIYKFNKDVYQDASNMFDCIIVTEGNDFGTMNRKTMSRLSIIGDRPTTNAYMQVSWSDNDQQTYNTPRSVNLNQDLPSINQLGSFRQRVFKFTFTENAPMRIQSVEVNINKGYS